MKTSEKLNAQDYDLNSNFFAWYPNEPGWSGEQMKSIRERGQKLMIVQLVDEDVTLLFWYDPNGSHIKQQLTVHYHSNSMLKKWIMRSEIEMVEAIYENFIR